jgi:hypothetical protein
MKKPGGKPGFFHFFQVHFRLILSHVILQYYVGFFH